ncbi:MAG: hypothetical protein A2176_05970 [Spirochaetes bacterium RBG_13_51_14]|nr:MAG: hypothetical protein A2176_05970 [Spirochaetes bacterium RBG_13_51_14]
MPKIGRNDPCPCGSGKKYKNCCWGENQKKLPGSAEENQLDLTYTKIAMEKEMTQFMHEDISQEQELVNDGWEALGANDTQEAKSLFQMAIKLAPNSADAYNGLADIAWRAGNMKSAEEYYRQAYEKAKQNLKTENPKAFYWWGELDTRPYMRARQGLGFVFLETGRFDQAILEFKELLKRNPNDNQGIRYLVAPIYLLKGETKAALGEYEWYERHYRNDVPDPYYLVNWGLTLFLDRQYEKSAKKFRLTIFENPYLIPVILKEKTKVLPIWHSNNLMEIDYARDYPMWFRELWSKQIRAKRFLEFLWTDIEIQADYDRWIEYWTELNGLKDIDRRTRLLDLSKKIVSKKPTASFLKRLGDFTR